MKTLTKSFAFLILIATVQAGPFGFQYGMTVEDIKKSGIKLEKSNTVVRWDFRTTGRVCFAVPGALVKDFLSCLSVCVEKKAHNFYFAKQSILFGFLDTSDFLEIQKFIPR